MKPTLPLIMSVLIISIVLMAGCASNSQPVSTSTPTSLKTPTRTYTPTSTPTATPDDPAEILDTYLFAYQNAGSLFPANVLYVYLSKNVTSSTTKENVGNVITLMKKNWQIFDYKIGKTEKRGNTATVTVDIIWQSNQGIQISRTEQIPLVFEDNKWRLDKFFYSP